ncbi:MAG: ornithine cyclodeaminase family protein [Alphaproteobacteria bacterium]|nr:ornithine cyclodeaminase family protein [Alphaproteobacteria bacterium]
MASAKIVFLDEAEVRALLSMEDLIPTMARALIDYSQGRVVQPGRQMLDVVEHGGFFGMMPAATGESVGAKLVTFYPENAKHDLHTHHALIVLFEAETGEPLAVLDGRLITEMRTAAVSAAVVDKVAPANARSLAILGTGVQARAHVSALRLVRPFDDIRVWGRSTENVAQLAEEVGARVLSAEDAVADADVVVTATAAKEPILKGAWLKQRAVVAAVGWNSNSGRELDDAAMQNVVIVESRTGTESESGNIRGSGAAIFAEAGEILAGDKTLEPGATVIFDSVGMAAEDVAAASLVWETYGRVG